MASRESILEEAAEARAETLATIRELTEAGETDGMGGGVPMPRLVSELDSSRGAIKCYVTTLREEGKVRKVNSRCSGYVRPSYLPVDEGDNNDSESRELRCDGGQVGGGTERGMPTEAVTIEFDGSEIETEVRSPAGWTVGSVSPNSASWKSEDGQHSAVHSIDLVGGTNQLTINGDVVAKGLNKREAAEWLECHSQDTEADRDE